jgi:hypothetical protein
MFVASCRRLVSRPRRSLTGCVALSALIASVPRAQTATFAGTVVGDSSGHAVGGAEVSIPKLGLRATTNYLGEFRFNRLPDGQVILQIRRLGFVPFTDTVTLAAGQQTNREYQLAVQVATLDSVAVTAPERKYISPGLAEFEERRKAGHGYFVSEETLRRNDERAMIDVVVGQVPGLSRFRVYPNRFYVGTTRKCAPGPAILNCRGQQSHCPVTLYIDGHVIYTATQGGEIPDLASFRVREYAGVEYYPGGATVPAKYNATDSGCGLLILWTRER